MKENKKSFGQRMAELRKAKKNKTSAQVSTNSKHFKFRFRKF